MTRGRDISLTLAFCLSLTVHAWIAYTVAERYAAYFSQLWMAALPAPEKQVAVPAPQPVPAPPPPRVVERMNMLGESEGVGEALASTPGQNPMQAPAAEQVQADLSLDPEGRDGKNDDAQSAPRPPAPPAFSAASPAQDQSREFSVPGSEMKPIEIARATNRNLPGPKESKAESNPADDQPKPPPLESKQTDAREKSRQPTAAPPSPAQQPQLAQANAPGDPSPQAESESDAFATTPSAEFSRGRTVARLGRKHKIIRPRLEMAGQADLMQLRPPVTIVLRLYLDPTGNVEKVEIVKSSGSINLDQPTLQAAYRWWFEPAKDSNGQPKRDVFEFACRFT